MKKLLMAVFLILSLSLPCLADTITLTWDAGYTGEDLQGYHIYRADRIEAYTTAWVRVGTVAKETTTYAEEVDNKNYAYMVTAYTESKESFPSNMAERYDRTPLPSVQNLRKE